MIKGYFLRCLIYQVVESTLVSTDMDIFVGILLPALALHNVFLDNSG